MSKATNPLVLLAAGLAIAGLILGVLSQPASAAPAHRQPVQRPAAAEPNPFAYVGSYRIEQTDQVERIQNQFTIILNSDYSAAVTMLTVFNDTLAISDGKGTWKVAAPDTVEVTLTEVNDQALDKPLVIELLFKDGFIVGIVADGQAQDVTGYRFTLGSGDRHPAVRSLHEKLAAIPWLNFQDPGPSGDVYGEATRRAVVQFQESQSLLATGIVDAETWAALDNPKTPDGWAPVTPPPTYAAPPGVETPAPALVPTRPPPTRPPPTPTQPPAPQPTACAPMVVMNDNVRLRSGPGTNFTELAMIPGGAQLSVTARNSAGTWYQVVYNGQQGWVFGELVTARCVENLPVVDVATPTPLPAPSSGGAQQPPPASGEQVVYLTFDDGPSAWTPQILDVLGRYNAKATFYQIGQQVGAGADAVRRQIGEGHSLGNHTWNHPSLDGLPRDQFFYQIQSTENAQREQGGYQKPGPHCLRPPYGATDGDTKPWAEELGYRIVLWTIDTNDWRMPGADQIANHVITHVYPGATVLMHDGGGNRSQTLAALEVVLQTLSQQGWRFETDCP